jgi:hypothetical protein
MTNWKIGDLCNANGWGDYLVMSSPTNEPAGEKRSEPIKLSKIVQAEGYTPPEYKGNEGWIIVAVSISEVPRIIAYDENFGALHYMLDTCGGDDGQENGIDDWPDDPGVYKGHFKVWTTSVHDYDGSDNDMGFNLVGKWETLWEPTT